MQPPFGSTEHVGRDSSHHFHVNNLKILLDISPFVAIFYFV